MDRVIVTYRVITLNHTTIDDVEFTEYEKTESVKAPNNFCQKYDSDDYISIDDLIQFNRIVSNPTVCNKNHLDNPNATDEYQKQIKKCESDYYFAINGKFIKPKYTKMKIYYDCAGAYHDGYCSGAECELDFKENNMIKIVDLPENLLGLYEDELENNEEDEIEIPVNKKMKRTYEFDIDQGGSLGSGYCDMPDSDIPIFKNVISCNTDYYVINKIVLSN